MLDCGSTFLETFKMHDRRHAMCADPKKFYIDMVEGLKDSRSTIQLHLRFAGTGLMRPFGASLDCNTHTQVLRSLRGPI